MRNEGIGRGRCEVWLIIRSILHSFLCPTGTDFGERCGRTRRERLMSAEGDRDMGRERPKVVAAIPCYNESGYIGDVVSVELRANGF